MAEDGISDSFWKVKNGVVHRGITDIKCNSPISFWVCLRFKKGLICAFCFLLHHAHMIPLYCTSSLEESAFILSLFLHVLLDIFPLGKYIYKRTGFIFIISQKMENPGTTLVYCSVYSFTVKLQAITTYLTYLTTICRTTKLLSPF